MHATPQEYYQHLYPYDQLVAWLTARGAYALERFEFALEGEIYKRYVMATSAADLRRQVSGFPGITAFHVGGIYPDRCDRRSAPAQRLFSIDIDLTDYDYLKLKDADGNVSPALCDKAYPVAVFAIFVLRYLLERAFGYRRIFACYSGRRGVHLHVLDASALALSNEARGAVATFMNASFAKGGRRISSAVRGLAKMYDLLKPAMDAFKRTLVGEMDLFGDSDQIVQFVERLELRHHTLDTLAEDAIEQDDGPAAWELIRERVLSAGVAWFRERLHDTVLAYVWPRMDENVSTSLGHLIKVPFCAHAKSRRVAVALNSKTYINWCPSRAPSLDEWDQDAMDAALANFELPTSDADLEDAVAAPAPRPPPRKVGFKRKQSPLVPN